MKNRIILPLLLCALAACGVDRNAAEYDQLRYDEMQKANCDEAAHMVSSKALMDKPQNYDDAFKRCQDTKSLSFEEYKALADYGRRTGSWDIYAVYPEKR
jgi:hypothetical protein